MTVKSNLIDDESQRCASEVQHGVDDDSRKKGVFNSPRARYRLLSLLTC